MLKSDLHKPQQENKIFAHRLHEHETFRVLGFDKPVQR